MSIKYLVMDVDGTLTDGRIYMGERGEIMKAFNIKDGCAISMLLPPAGITPVIITGRSSQIVANRCNEIGIKYLYQGVVDKTAKLKELLLEEGRTFSDVAYIGDDLNDLTCMRVIKERGGIIGAPANACREVKEIADYVTFSAGGDGSVREFVEWLINSIL